ncbi:MAG: DUF2279 domain-containing protein [Pseudomonadota bacterium]
MPIRSKYPRLLLSMAAGLVFLVAADMRTPAYSADAEIDTYVIDSKGTTHYHNGERVCRTNCDTQPTGALPRPLASDLVIPDRRVTSRVVSADRFPLRPQVSTRYPLKPEELTQYPVRPVAAPQQAAPRYPAQPVAAQAQSFPRYPADLPPPQPAPTRPLPAAAAAPLPTVPTPAPNAKKVQAAASADTAALSEDQSGLTKEEKAILLNVGAVSAITIYGLINWDYFQTAPKAGQEGWFGRTTSSGGADKLGHFWTTYAGGHLFAYLYRWWDFDDETANTLGAVSSLGVQTLMEVGDAFSGGFGFSYEDALMNVAGAGAAYILGKYPSLGRKIDFRFEYAPKNVGDITDDLFTDYENQRYLVALKLDGFDMFRDSYLSYLELHAGYYTRGFEEFNPGEPDNRRRNIFFGAGFNVSKLVRNFVDVGVFDYVQVPYTSVNVKKSLD